MIVVCFFQVVDVIALDISHQKQPSVSKIPLKTDLMTSLLFDLKKVKGISAFLAL